MKYNYNKYSGENYRQKSKDFEALVFPFMDQLYTTALTMTRDTHNAEDLVQTTYLKAYRFFHQFKPETNFRAWIFRILTNNFINEYRQKKRLPAKVDFETTCAILPEEDNSETTFIPKEEFNQNYEEYFDDTVTAALDNLPEKYRIVVLLSDVNELKYKEIAEVVDCPIGTVMSRLSRGRKYLAQSLKKYGALKGKTSVIGGSYSFPNTI